MARPEAASRASEGGVFWGGGGGDVSRAGDDNRRF